MWFRLAKELGMSVREAQERIDSAEFGEWNAYYTIEPFGDRVEDLRAGTIASMIANVNRGKGTDPYGALHFLPWTKDPDPDVQGVPSAEEMATSLFGINLAELKRNGTKSIVIQRRKS